MDMCEANKKSMVMSGVYDMYSFARQRLEVYERDLAAAEAAKAAQNATPWMKIAASQLGVREYAQSKHNAAVLKYHATTTGKFKDDETPWCSSFVNWTMKSAGLGGTNSALALSWRSYGVKLAQPAYGSIAILNYGNGKGHVGFVAGTDNNGHLILLGGNQTNSVRYSAFLAASVSNYVYPIGFTPNYVLPYVKIPANGKNSTR
jgi:uncharacterized protein (TIGR02594 family)